MSAITAMKIVAIVNLAVAALCPLIWYIYYQRRVVPRLPGTEMTLTRRGIHKQLIKLVIESSLIYIAWAGFWYTMSIMPTAGAKLGFVAAERVGLVLLIAGLLSLGVVVSSLFMAIATFAKVQAMTPRSG